MGEESSLPPIMTKLNLSDIKNEFRLSESDGLFINYGIEESAFPYKYQDMYDRSLSFTDVDSAVLENEHLRAVFLPGLGGKLWSLVDKDTGKELLFRNPVIRPCNLGIRNAWTSGGVEWNGGVKGHGPFTCSQVFTAQTSLRDGTPVLRFYEFERIRCAVFQLDAFLPEGSRFLYVGVRLTNPTDKVVPMYWWSNIGVVEKEGDRVIVPADKAYTAPSDCVVKIDIPVHNGIDVTYPAANITSNDYFFVTRDARRKFVCQLDKDGYGLVQTSTDRLKGRKLFVWGNSQGGHKWRNFLTDDNETGSYDEIQAGIADTQYESLPMPPHTSWDWLEAYGAMSADAGKVHGDYAGARQEAERVLDAVLPKEKLDALYREAAEIATCPAKKTIFYADGWGALERERRVSSGEYPLAPHLDFGAIGPEQAEWLTLMNTGKTGEHDPAEPPASYMRQREWLDMLVCAADRTDRKNWYPSYLVGTALIAEGEYDRAEKYIKKSLRIEDTVWANYAYAVLMKKTDRRDRERELMLRAYSIRADLSLAKEVMRTLFETEADREAIELYESASDEVRGSERVKLYYAYALARTGRVKEAEKLLLGDGYLVVPDIRECELTETRLWFLIRELTKKEGEETGEPPRDLDFRMFTKREGWFGA